MSIFANHIRRWEESVESVSEGIQTPNGIIENPDVIDAYMQSHDKLIAIL